MSYLSKGTAHKMESVAKAESIKVQRYVSAGDAARKVGISALVFSRLAGSITVSLNRETIVNIGEAQSLGKRDEARGRRWPAKSQKKSLVLGTQSILAFGLGTTFRSRHQICTARAVCCRILPSSS